MSRRTGRAVAIGYKDIWKLSFPIILGSATQNIIVLSDSIFLYGRSEVEFAAVGFVSLFYLFITAIGFGFSKGGQILISRRYSEGDDRQLGSTFRSMMYFELLLAVVLFLLIWFFCPLFFSYILDTKSLISYSLEYIRYRSFGIFFSFVGISFIAYYSGIGKTKIIAIDTIILTVVNLFLNYSLIFGKFGLPEMGISGAGLASSLAEIVAFIVFLLYILWDPNSQRHQLFLSSKIDVDVVKKMLSVSFPFVIQFISSIGSWLFFFGMIENLGQRALAISNLVRVIYILLSIPSWGLATGVQTLVSQCIGAGNNSRVLLVSNKTVALNMIITLSLALPVLLIPWHYWMSDLLLEQLEVLQQARPLFPIILIILLFFAAGSIYHSAVMSAGELWTGLRLQLMVVVVYLSAAYVLVNIVESRLVWIWALEIFYWLVLGSASIYLLYRGKWRKLKL